MALKEMEIAEFVLWDGKAVTDSCYKYKYVGEIFFPIDHV